LAEPINSEGQAEDDKEAMQKMSEDHALLDGNVKRILWSKIT